MKKTFFLKLALSLLVFGILFYKVDLGETYQIITTISLLTLIVILAAHPVTWLFTAFNLKVLLRPFNKKISLRRLLKYSFFSWSTGALAPGKIGELSLIHLLKKEKIEYGQGSTIFVLNKLVILFLYVIVSVVGFFIFFTVEQAFKLILILAVMLIILFFFIITEKGRYLIKKFILGKYAENFRGFSRNLFYFLKYKKNLLFLNLMLTIIRWFVLCLLFYMTILLFNGPLISFAYVLMIFAMGMIISLIPISLSGMGVREAAFVFLYAKIGVSAPLILAINLVYLAIGYFYVLVALIIYRN